MTQKLALALTLVLVALSLPLLAAPPSSGGPQAGPAVAVQAPAPGVGALPAGDPAPAAAALPVWAGPMAQASSATAPQAIDGTPFLTTCSGCTGSACFRLHSCVLQGCC